MEETFDLTTYLNKGSESLIADILRSTLRNPKETLFLQRYHSCQPGMEARRMAHEAEGLHIPLFLIASITSACTRGSSDSLGSTTTSPERASS